MTTKTKHLMIAFVAALLFGAPATAGVTDNIKIPFSQDVFIDCANAGLGELLTISGQLHILFTETQDSAGGLHLTFHFQPQGATGIGPETGDLYRAVGITRGTLNVATDGLPFIDTFVNNFYMIGTANGVKFKLHNTVHVTVNANGDLAAEVDNSSATCM